MAGFLVSVNVENKKVEMPGTAGLDNGMESGTSKPKRGYRKNRSEEGGDGKFGFRVLNLKCLSMKLFASVLLVTSK